MDLKSLLDVDPDNWPDHEYFELAAKSRDYIDEKLYAMVTQEGNPFLHDWLFIGFECQNPNETNGFGWPSFSVVLEDEPDSRVNLLFGQIMDLAIKTDMEQRNCPYMDGVLKAYVLPGSGFTEFVMRLSDGMAVYVKSPGVRVVKEDW